MKKKLVVLMTLVVVLAFAIGAMAMPAGKTKVFETKMGTVTFSSDIHKDKGIGCMDCHKSIFKMQAGAAKLSIPHKAGESCGTCHDGTKAFSQTDTATCKSCHK